MPPEDPIRPGDWVVWSGFVNEHHEHVFKLLGHGPFKVSKVDECGSLWFVGKKKHGPFYRPRFRKDAFITAVKEALKDE